MLNAHFAGLFPRLLSQFCNKPQISAAAKNVLAICILLLSHYYTAISMLHYFT